MLPLTSSLNSQSDLRFASKRSYLLVLAFTLDLVFVTFQNLGKRMGN